MNCIQVEEQLSPYFDGELNGKRAEIAEHLQTCAQCTAALSRIRSLATLMRELPDPAVPKMWPGIERALDRAADQVSVALPWRERLRGMASWIKGPTWHWPVGLAAVAASLLIGFFTWPLLHSDMAHDRMAVNLSHFVTQFASDPEGAQHELQSQYASRPIQPADAIRLVNYTPAAPEQLADGLLRKQMYLVEMPCCKCVQSIYCRADGSSVAVFEHVADDPASLGDHPTIHANCSGKDVCLVQCSGQLAATWKDKNRYITLVGAKDLEDASRLIAAFDGHTT